MVLVLNGKNDVRDLINTNIDQAGVGTGTGTAPTENDTGLNSNTNLGTTDTILSTTNSTSDKTVKFEYTLPSTEANGNSFTEFGLSNSTTSNLFNRQTFVAVSKTSSVEFSILTICEIE